MRVERSSPPQPPVSPHFHAARSYDYSAESVLVSPHAPSFPRLARFFTWLWSYLRILFSCLLPKEKAKEPAPALSAEVLRLIAKAWQKEQPAPPPPAPDAMASSSTWKNYAGLAGAAALLYWQRKNISSFVTAIPNKVFWIAKTIVIDQLPTMAATTAIKKSQPKIEQIVQRIFSAPAWIAKSAGLTIPAACIWYASHHLGYPLGQFYLGYLAQFTLPQSPAVMLTTSIGISAVSRYIEQEKLFWTILACNIAVFARQTFKPVALEEKAAQASALQT